MVSRGKNVFKMAIWLKAIIHHLNSPRGNVQSPPSRLCLSSKEHVGTWERRYLVCSPGMEEKGSLVLSWSSDICLLEGFPFSSWLLCLLLVSSVVCGGWTCGPFFALGNAMDGTAWPPLTPARGRTWLCWVLHQDQWTHLPQSFLQDQVFLYSDPMTVPQSFNTVAMLPENCRLPEKFILRASLPDCPLHTKKEFQWVWNYYPKPCLQGWLVAGI